MMGKKRKARTTLENTNNKKTKINFLRRNHNMLERYITRKDISSTKGKTVGESIRD